MSSTSTKIIDAGQFLGYHIGRMEEQRKDWMRRARRSRDMGSQRLVLLHVKFARETNRDLVRYLRSLKEVPA